MLQVVLIAVGGSLGCVARYGMSTAVYAATPGVYPWGTLFVNLTEGLVTLEKMRMIKYRHS